MDIIMDVRRYPRKVRSLARWSRAAEKSTSQLTCEDQNLASGVLADSAGGTADPSPRGSGSWSGCDCGDDEVEEDCVMRGERLWREYTEGERLLADESIVVLKWRVTTNSIRNADVTNR